MNEEILQLEELELGDLYDKTVRLIDETFGKKIPKEIAQDMLKAKNGITIKCHIKVLDQQIGFTEKPKLGIIIHRGQQYKIEDILDEETERRIILQRICRELLEEEDESVRGMTQADEIKHLQKNNGE